MAQIVSLLLRSLSTFSFVSLVLCISLPALAGGDAKKTIKQIPVRPEFLLENSEPSPKTDDNKDRDDDSDEKEDAPAVAEKGNAETDAAETDAASGGVPKVVPVQNADTDSGLPAPSQDPRIPQSSLNADPFQSFPSGNDTQKTAPQNESKTTAKEAPAEGPKARTHPRPVHIPKHRAPDPGLAIWGVFPIQLCSGWAMGLFMCPVSLGTLGLGGCCAPAAVTAVEVIAGDSTGLERGTFLWPMISSYCAGAACAIPFLGVWGAVFGTAAYAAGQQDQNLAVGSLAAGAWSAALIPVAVVSVLGGMTVAPALVYQLQSEPKRLDDPDFRLPGFTTPAHRFKDGEPISLPIPPTVSLMRY